MDDKKKSAIDKFVDTVTTAVGNIAKNAVMPTREKDTEAIAEKTNEQMFLGDAAIAPEAIPAPVRTSRKKVTKTKLGKTNKASSTPKKVAPKVTKQRAAKKSKPSTARKGVGKKKAAKKAAAKKRKSSKRR